MISLPGNQDVIHFEDRMSEVLGLDHGWLCENLEWLLTGLVTVIKADKTGLIKYSSLKYSLCKVSL